MKDEDKLTVSAWFSVSKDSVSGINQTHFGVWGGGVGAKERDSAC